MQTEIIAQAYAATGQHTLDNEEPFHSGFPSPADNYIEHSLDLNQQLIRHPSATFIMRVQGNAMVNAGIKDGDLLIVDRAIQPHPGKVVIAAVNGELTVKRLVQRSGQFWLQPDNPHYRPIPMTDENEAFVWGTVAHVIHTL
ncbi:LexA family protein [Oceanospirillum beijerinckii]|uniref:LexA family protein n=1 Tax=Oceanospirillum beijerinckii TaxID=64976 RepID=UPI000421C5DF|nr:translesion error-prone DNA polymerase V autoproteolytic subunit [Oceanospirillum beijerinckii]MAC46369.1 peptidase S24 [Oceanospirillum sp.]